MPRSRPRCGWSATQPRSRSVRVCKDVPFGTELGEVIEGIGTLEDKDGQIQHGPEERDGEQATGDTTSHQHQYQHRDGNGRPERELEQEIDYEVREVGRKQCEDYAPGF